MRSLLPTIVGFIFLMLLAPFHESMEDQQVIHDHKNYPRCIANGIKCTELTVCGDTATVFNSGKHVPISERHMKVIVDKPE